MKVTLAHLTLQTKIMWNGYIRHRATVPPVVELHFSPSYLPSVGCLGIGCWDLVIAPAPTNVYTYEEGWWMELSSQLESR